MPNDAFTQQALAADQRFRLRVREALAKIAWQVLGEDPETANHAARAAYARSVISHLDAIAGQIAPWLVVRENVFNFTTSYDFSIGAVVTASGDADIESQLSTDWNHLAGL